MAKQKTSSKRSNSMDAEASKKIMNAIDMIEAETSVQLSKMVNMQNLRDFDSVRFHLKNLRRKFSILAAPSPISAKEVWEC